MVPSSPSPTERGRAAPSFWPMSVVAKRLPISATAEMLLRWTWFSQLPLDFFLYLEEKRIFGNDLCRYFAGLPALPDTKWTENSVDKTYYFIWVRNILTLLWDGQHKLPRTDTVSVWPSVQIFEALDLLWTDVHSASHVSSPSATLRRSPSVLSGKSDADSASTVIASVTRGSHLSPLQLLEVGKYWLVTS